jgi:thiosulfate/3-mercaptopyruvate sulfurtransferase
VVDVRDAWEFDGIGHVPGAVNVPFDSFRSDPAGEGDAAADDGDAAADDGDAAADAGTNGDGVEDGDGDGATGDTGSYGEADAEAAERDGEPAGTLPGVDVWEELLSDAGIEPDDTLVAYDDTHGVFAARFLVTALAYGHDDVHLLDGDFSAWSRDHEVERGTPTVERTDYVARDPESTPFVDFETVGAALDDPDVAVLDTREPWEWEEGHLPGAVQLDWRELVDDETRGLKPDAELAAVLDAHGVTPDRRVLLYCNTARRISHTYVVLRHLGYEDVMFYEGSLSEWAARGGPTESA